MGAHTGLEDSKGRNGEEAAKKQRRVKLRESSFIGAF
jgi:hypothetical protein